MTKDKALERLARAVVHETNEKLMGRIWEDNWNPEAHIEIALTIDELRCAAYLHHGQAPLWWSKPPNRPKTSPFSVPSKPAGA